MVLGREMTRRETTDAPVSRFVVRAAVVLCLALAALILVVDADEYPGMSRAGLRVFVRGVLPLLLVAALNLRAVRAGRGWRLGALAANVALLADALRLVTRGGPPVGWLLLGVASLLVVGSAGLLRRRAGERAR